MAFPPDFALFAYLSMQELGLNLRELIPEFTLLPGVLVPTLQFLVVKDLGTCSKRITSLQ